MDASIVTLGTAGAKDVLRQLFLDGPTWDGNIISKAGRDDLIAVGFADRRNGWAFLTGLGVEYAIASGLNREKDRRRVFTATASPE